MQLNSAERPTRGYFIDKQEGATRSIKYFGHFNVNIDIGTPLISSRRRRTCVPIEMCKSRCRIFCFGCTPQNNAERHQTDALR